MREQIAKEIWHRFANSSVQAWDDETHKAEYLGCADAILKTRDEKIEKLRAALLAMVDRWEPDCSGQDRVMYDNAVEAIEFSNSEAK